MITNLIWIRFDEGDRRTPAPDFCLPSAHGEMVCRHSLGEEDRLALIFPAMAQSDRAAALLSSFSARINDYAQEETRIMAILPCQPAELADLAAQAGEHILLLSDPESATRARYTADIAPGLIKEADHLIFLLDAYGAPYAAVAGQAYDEAGLHADLLSWLQYIGLQCPE